MFYPRYGGSENCKTLLWPQKQKTIVWGCLIAQMKRLDALITMHKTWTPCNVPLLKKSRKIPKNYIFFKTIVIGSFSWFFQQRYSFKSWIFFCVVTIASRRFIWAIKHPHMMILIFRVIMGFCNVLEPLYQE